MIHSIELALYLAISAFLIVKTFQRSIWGVGYYVLNFFAHPQYWEWGNPLPGWVRWSMTAAVLMLGSMYMHGQEREFRKDSGISRTSILAILLAVNGLLIHVAFSIHETSWEVYIEMFKFVILYFVIKTIVQSRKDFVLLNWFFVCGIFYWGFEARVLGNLTMKDGRLEGFGGPGCARSNELASVLVSMLPPCVGFLALVKIKQKLVIGAAAMLGLNLMLITQSRGGFIGIIGAGITIPLVASGKARKYAIQGVAVGVLAFILLAGNPQIMARFMSTFSDEAETSAQKIDQENKESRKFFWGVGLQMLNDYPFGSGGDTFSSNRGIEYLKRNRAPYINKSVHQGYISEALDWGVQGLLIHLGFTFSTMWCAFTTSRFRRKIGDNSAAFYGACLLGGFSALLIGCLVGDFYHLEWGYWLAILAICYTKLYGRANYGVVPEIEVTPAQAEQGDADLLKELALENT